MFRLPRQRTSNLNQTIMSSNLVDFPTTYVYKQLRSDRHVRLLEIVGFECNTTPLPEKQLPGHDAGRTVSSDSFKIQSTDKRSRRLTVFRDSPFIA
jgi:hypothetical protein